MIGIYQDWSFSVESLSDSKTKWSIYLFTLSKKVFTALSAMVLEVKKICSVSSIAQPRDRYLNNKTINMTH